MRYLSLAEVIELHRRGFDQSGGALGLRNIGGLESAIAHPRMTFGGQDLYRHTDREGGCIVFLIRAESSVCRWK